MATPFAALEQRMAGMCMSRLANVSCAANGVEFFAQFDTADRTAFDAVTAGDYTLRYLASGVALKQGDDVVVDGVAYQVADVPARINAQEFVAGLVRD